MGIETNRDLTIIVIKEFIKQRKLEFEQKMERKRQKGNIQNAPFFTYKSLIINFLFTNFYCLF